MFREFNISSYTKSYNFGYLSTNDRLKGNDNWSCFFRDSYFLGNYEKEENEWKKMKNADAVFLFCILIWEYAANEEVLVFSKSLFVPNS